MVTDYKAWDETRQVPSGYLEGGSATTKEDLGKEPRGRD